VDDAPAHLVLDLPPAVAGDGGAEVGAGLEQGVAHGLGEVEQGRVVGAGEQRDDEQDEVV